MLCCVRRHDKCKLGIHMDGKELLLYALQNQYLLEKGGRMDILSGLCGLQAQFAGNPRYSLRIRARDFSEDGWSDGLLKIWTHRNTIHVIRADELGLFLSAKGDHDAWEENWWGIPPRVKPYWSAFIREKVAEGIDGREALKNACRGAGMEETLLKRIFHGWGGLIKEMSDRGMIAYHPGTEKRFLLPPEPAWMDRDEARLIILRRYFQNFGPATVEDCASFTGFRLPEIRALLRRGTVPLKSAECGGTSYYYLGELQASRSLPPCIYLSGFDQLVMGYRDRSRFLNPADKRLAVNQAGIVYPAILLHGRLCARWKKEKNKLLITPFHPLSLSDQRLAESGGRKLFHGEKLEVKFLPSCRP